MHVKEPTSLLAKSREKSRWSGQTAQTGSYIRVVRPTGHFIKLTFRHPGRPGDCQIINDNNNNLADCTWSFICESGFQEGDCPNKYSPPKSWWAESRETTKAHTCEMHGDGTGNTSETGSIVSIRNSEHVTLHVDITKKKWNTSLVTSRQQVTAHLQ